MMQDTTITFKRSMTRFLYYAGDIFRPTRDKFVPEFSKLYGVYLQYVQKTSLNKWSKDRQRQSKIYIQTKIATELQIMFKSKG